MTDQSTTRKSVLDRFLDVVERGGNALPHPATLFAMLALLVILLVARPLIGMIGRVGAAVAAATMSTDLTGWRVFQWLRRSVLDG